MAAAAAWTALMLPGFDRLRAAVRLPPAAVAYARAGDTVALARALARGADPNARRAGAGAVHYAAAQGERAALRLLLAHGADPNLPSSPDGVTPLGAAAAHDDSAVIGALAAAGADLNRRSRWGQTPVYASVDHNGHAALERLIALGADLERADVSGVSPLGFALLRGDTVAARLLIAGGASLDRPQGGEATPREIVQKSPAWLRVWVARYAARPPDGRPRGP